MMAMTIAELSAKFGRIKTKLTEITAESVNNSHEHIMEVAKERTPVDTGALRDSGIVKPPEIKYTSVTSVGSFGGGEIDYAVEVHEDLQAHHFNGQAKFYSSASQEMKNGAIEQLNVDVMNLVESG